MIRRLLPWLAVAGWGWLLWLAIEPWNALGGLVDERLRWLCHAVAGMAAILGHTAGDLLRPRARLLFYPALAAALLAIAGLEGCGLDDGAGIAFVGWLAYNAGATLGWLDIGSTPQPGDAPESRVK